MLCFFLLLLLSLLIILHIYSRYNRRSRYILKIPGPKPYPIIGNLLMFNVSCLNKFWQTAREVNKTYYPVSRYFSVTKGIVNVYHPDDLEIVLTSQKILQKGWVYDHLHPWLQQGLLTSTGDKWRQRRKILTPAFHFSILKKYMEIILEQEEKLIEMLRSQEKEATYNLVKLCSEHTLNVICESTMGINLNNMDVKMVHTYKNAIYEMGNIVLYRIPRPYIKNWMLPTVYFRINNWQKRVVNTLHSFTKNLIKQREEYHKLTNNKYLNECLDQVEGNNEDYETLSGQKKRLAMLDLLLAAKSEGLIDDNGIQEEVDTFTFEGHDTTGMALTYSLLLLAEHKEAQDRARAEVIAAFKKNGGKLNRDFSRLNYLERCIKESIRLFPPVATILRYTSQDLQLKNAFIPADTHIMMHLFDTHRDPNFWTDSEKFDPDRFLPENSKNRHLFAYLPFSAGPRNCIGQKFAMMEMKSFLAKILYNFYLEPVDRLQNLKLIADIVLRPLNPIHIKLIRIDKL